MTLETESRASKKLSAGYLSDRDPWDCGGHCELCHFDKFYDTRRAREDRQWRKDWL
jgi:hypothetical protein